MVSSLNIFSWIQISVNLI